ncbi:MULTISPECIES: cofactor-independent phosphoglycerate mutase [unclassified Archaeoglobus]|jgi:2,3-bisphosphoglycerate-independent phosphoglycerate mutase|uniref:cofactor-independent phosphoglycerate mutase n=1 Tax=unclassified Archaeoglobus TaxID=2643606 RepID=UPI0025B9C3E2|nr:MULTISPECIES: cofactor-independent phosphoglycerate mutase [unclassified Archaeoglobus]
MKYLILIPDGMADWRVERLGNRTPLEVAETENMDFIAREGACGIAKTVPNGFEPGSDVANLTILGVDVRKHYTGRGPIEALARGVSGEIVFRCNLVRVDDGVMVDYSAGRISDEEARKVIEVLNTEKPHEFVEFHAGKSYRNLLIFNKRFEDKVRTYPPHDIQGRKIEPYMPSDGELADILRKLMDWSAEVVPGVTEKANMIWPWGGGKMPQFPDFRRRYGIRAAMITEVDLLEGIAKGMGMDVVEVEGVTGYIDTNYRKLVRECIKALKEYDLVLLHTEGIDEVSHEGDAELKVEAIEMYDEKIVGKILDRIELDEVKILLLPDHPTPVKVRTHVAEPVPFAVYGVRKDDVKVYSERSCAKGRFGRINGLELMNLLTAKN